MCLPVNDWCRSDLISVGMPTSAENNVKALVAYSSVCLGVARIYAYLPFVITNAPTFCLIDFTDDSR